MGELSLSAAGRRAEGGSGGAVGERRSGRPTPANFAAVKPYHSTKLCAEARRRAKLRDGTRLRDSAKTPWRLYKAPQRPHTTRNSATRTKTPRLRKTARRPPSRPSRPCPRFSAPCATARSADLERRGPSVSAIRRRTGGVDRRASVLSQSPVRARPVCACERARARAAVPCRWAVALAHGGSDWWRAGLSRHGAGGVLRPGAWTGARNGWSLERSLVRSVGRSLVRSLNWSLGRSSESPTAPTLRRGGGRRARRCRRRS